MNTQLAQTPLHDWHAAHGGRMVDFAGWSMPVQYTSIVEEHQATRSAVGLFDISHMGRIRFDGERAGAYLDRLLTRQVSQMPLGKIVYNLVVNEAGGILDDILVYRLVDQFQNHYFLVVCNASNREKLLRWFDDHPPIAGEDVFRTDCTHDWGMIAVQGPRAIELVTPLAQAPVEALKYYTGIETEIAGGGGLVSRTGYTGEDGVELIIGAKAVARVWETLLAAGAELGAKACGLGARDTLRLEAAMPLYGHELSEELDPFQAGLDFAVQLNRGPFIGREALKERQALPRPKRVGLSLEGKRVPREGYPILAGGEQVGVVTSGTFSPTLQKPIAMGYIQPDRAQVGTEAAIDIRGKSEPAQIVKLPFYKRPAYET